MPTIAEMRAELEAIKAEEARKAAELKRLEDAKDAKERAKLKSQTALETFLNDTLNYHLAIGEVPEKLFLNLANQSADRPDFVAGATYDLLQSPFGLRETAKGSWRFNGKVYETIDHVAKAIELLGNSQMPYGWLRRLMIPVETEFPAVARATAIKAALAQPPQLSDEMSWEDQMRAKALLGEVAF